MTREEAIEYVAYFTGLTRETLEEELKAGMVAIVALRHKAVLLPEYGVNGMSRDECSWAFLDMGAKQDTGMYGDVYYFKDMEKVGVWVEEN